MGKIFEESLMRGARNSILYAFLWEVRVCFYSRLEIMMHLILVEGILTPRR
jgi:hypothetical protein